MGPRPDGRGKIVIGVALAGIFYCVNGAAARRPRKGIKGLWILQLGLASMGPRPDGRGKRNARRHLDVPCYASMGPRPDGRGKARPQPHGGLGRRRQWGRGQTAAESRAWRQALNRTLASMGPRPDGRGKSDGPIQPVSGAERQWGRGQTAAERPGLQSRTDLQFCVNGAAARRPRKVRRPDGWHFIPPVRQWGRGQTAAERMPPAQRPNQMGRRQWGRGQTAAESACLPWEGGGYKASMGPRPDGRGKSLNLTCRATLK